MKRNVLMAAVFSVLISFPVFASEDLGYANTLAQNNERQYQTEVSLGLYGSTEGLLRPSAYDQRDRYFYGLDGELYFSPAGWDSKVLKSGRNEAGILFGKDGEMVNPIYEGKYVDSGIDGLAARFEQGERLTFPGRQEVLNFLEYYTYGYRLGFPAGEYNLAHTDGNGYSVMLGESMRYDRQSVRSLILSEVGPLSGDTPYEKIYDACRKLDGWEYDASYSTKPMDEAIRNRKGVCWHFAKVAAVLLEDAGFETEIMVGLVDNYGTTGDAHEMLRCKVDGKWIYVDPTLFQTTGRWYANMSYSLFTLNFKAIRGVSLF